MENLNTLTLHATIEILKKASFLDIQKAGYHFQRNDFYSPLNDCYFLERTDNLKQAFVDDILPHLGLFLQGPFPLPGNRVTRSAWDCRGKLGAYEAAGIIPQIMGSRVLDIGCNAGYDTFLMSSLGAIEAVGIEPHGFYHQASFLNAGYDVPGVSFLNLGWEDLDPRFFGGFDFVNCQGLIYHIKKPMLMIEKLASIMRPGATLLMETHVLLEISSHAPQGRLRQPESIKSKGNS